MAGASPGRNCCQCPAVIDHLSQNELISITLDITIFFRDNEGLKEQLQKLLGHRATPRSIIIDTAYYKFDIE